MMKAVINGLRYDTETAELLAHLPGGADSRSDFRYEDTAIYRTQKGRYFLAGEGGALTRWRRSLGSGGWTGGEGILALSDDEAREHLEKCGQAGVAVIEKYFPIEDA
jgi:hypothetical protein